MERHEIEIEVKWSEPGSYDDAKDYRLCVYVHERDGRIFYVGEAKKTFFGGDKRLDSKIIDNETMDRPERSPRNATSYRHWINALLMTGSRLFIGEVLCGDTTCELKSIIDRKTDRKTIITVHSEKMHTKIVTEVERHLRWQLQPELDRSPNTRIRSPHRIEHLDNDGVPPFLRDARANA